MKTNAAYTIALILSSLTACVEPIIMDSEEDMPVVVHCILTRDLKSELRDKSFVPTQNLNLYYAKRLTDSGDYKTINKAEISVSGGGETFDFVWNGDGWTSSFTPAFGTEYTLTVRLDNGKVLTSKTIFPIKVAFSTVPVYADNMSFATIACYVRVLDCVKDIDIWVTAFKGREYDTQHFCTNHPGASNINVGDKSLQDLPVFHQIISNMKSHLERTVKPDETLFNNYLNSCAYLPAHSRFLKIHHPANFDNGHDEPLLQRKLGKDEIEYEQCRDGFILLSDTVDQIPGYVPYMTVYPFEYHVLSSEYDQYLFNLVKYRLNYDEFTNLYSFDSSYTNIEGGLGIFGAMY